MEPWERLFRRHRADDLADIVVRLTRVLLARGVCTADDARVVPIRGDPRVRGAAMRTLVGLGLAVKSTEVKSAAEVCHHRPIRRFVLVNPTGARLMLQHVETRVLCLRATETRYKSDSKGQLLLAV